MFNLSILKKDEEEWRKLVDERNILLDAWFLRFSTKKRNRIIEIDKRLDEMEMECYKYIQAEKLKTLKDN